MFKNEKCDIKKIEEKMKKIIKRCDELNTPEVETRIERLRRNFEYGSKNEERINSYMSFREIEKSRKACTEELQTLTDQVMECALKEIKQKSAII